MQECAGTSVLQEFRVCVPAAQELQFPAAKEPAQEDAAKLALGNSLSVLKF